MAIIWERLPKQFYDTVLKRFVRRESAIWKLEFRAGRVRDQYGRFVPRWAISAVERDKIISKTNIIFDYHKISEAEKYMLVGINERIIERVVYYDDRNRLRIAYISTRMGMGWDDEEMKRKWYGVMSQKLGWVGQPSSKIRQRVLVRDFYVCKTTLPTS